MEEKLKTRLAELKSEYQKGQEKLAQLEKETTNTQTAILRISGAIQVLEELLAEKSDGSERVSSSDNGQVEQVDVD